MNNFVKRSLCVLCALLVAFTFSVRPHAIVGVDDAVLVGTSAVALLFLSWCGITFGTNADAVAGVQAYLENTVDGAKRLAAIAEQYVSDGTLKMTAAVKSAYKDLKDGIREFFQTPEDSYSGSLAGSVCAGVAYAPMPCPGFDWRDKSTYPSMFRFPFLPGAVYRLDYTDGYYIIATVSHMSDDRYSVSFRGFDSAGTDLSTFGMVTGTSSDSFEILAEREEIGTYPILISYKSTGKFGVSSVGFTTSKFPGLSLVSITVSSSKGVGFSQDKIVDGSSALKILEPVELPDPTPGQDPDPDQKPKEFPILPLETVVERGTSKDTDEDGNKVSEADPSLSPDELVEALRKLLEDAQPNPDPDPTTPDDSDGDQYGKKHDAKWSEVFPFCIPFDLIEFLNVLAADPEAPHFTWKFDFGEKLGQHELEIDLSDFDEVAQIVRTLELLAFCVGLILLTRNIIRG